MFDGWLIFGTTELFETIRVHGLHFFRISIPFVHCTRMNLNRRNRFTTVLFALFSLLFMQLAVAAYVCPGRTAQVVKMVGKSTMAEAGMPCAESMPTAMDEDQPSLCQAHCQATEQSSDSYQLLPIASLSDLVPGFAPPRVLPVPQGAPLQAPLLRRTTTPPLAVRHCCFRI